ncbi:TPA: ornithine carbamoyltransferase [Candidatus Bipolaricaulota bacterium]|nr:ornithine carbamoyltransferase [Candidatus Bipolaricaulota bacterium]
MSWYDLKGRDLISEVDWSKEEYDIAIKLTDHLKGMYYSGQPHPYLKYKTFAMMFFAGSTRTRMSFETAMTQLGGHSQFISPKTLRLSLEDKPGAGETIQDTAKAMSRFCDGIGIRLLDDAIDYYGHGDAVIRKFAEHADVPVINMASDINHPCQSLTDIYTIMEKIGEPKGKKIVITWAYSPWIRGRCSVQGTALIAAMYGMEVVVAHPPEYDLDPKVMDQCRELASKSGGSFEITNDMDKALDGATIVFPRNWFTGRRYEVGKEEELKIARKYTDWRYTAERQKKLGAPGYLLHCMPIDRGNEVDPEVCDNELSWIYDQAENRLHTQKAILTLTLGGRL